MTAKKQKICKTKQKQQISLILGEKQRAREKEKATVSIIMVPFRIKYEINAFII